MIINNLNLEGIAVSPPKADPPLVIDANAVLASAIALELLQAVAGRDAEIVELLGGIHQSQLAEHDAVKLGGEAPDAFAPEQPLGIAIGEAGDHYANSNAARP